MPQLGSLLIPVQAATRQVFFVLMERREAPHKKCYALSQCCSDEEIGLLRLNHNEGDYIGPIFYGKANGLGKCVWSKGPLFGDSYEGYFKDNRMHGNGKLVFYGGNYYDGNFDNDMFHGYGELTYPDGRRYVGEFRRNHLEGYGKLTYPDSSVHEGRFSKSECNGWGKRTYPDGSVYEGNWKDNKPSEASKDQNCFDLCLLC